MDNTNDTQIVELMRQQPAWFESLIAACFIFCPEFFQDTVTTLIEETGQIQDFSQPLDNIMAEGGRLFHMAVRDRSKAPNWDYLSMYAQVQITQGKMMPQEAAAYSQRFADLIKVDVAGLYPMALRGFPYWVALQRSKKVITGLRVGKMDDLNEIMVQLKKAQAPMSSTYGEQVVTSMLQALMKAKDCILRYPCDLKGLNHAMGGGMAKKELALFVAPPGGGKTVLAVQLAVSWAIDCNLRGIIITTEQPPEELIPRVVANRARIDFSLVKDGVDLAKLPPEKRELALQCVESLNRCHIMDWRQGRSRDIITDFDTEIDRHEEKIGAKIDFFVFDWLGRGVKYKAGDQQSKRLGMLDGMNSLCDAVKRRGIFGATFAQASVAQARGQAMVDDTMIAECKNLSEPATVGVGISTEMIENQDGKKPIYKEVQHMFPFKLRKSAVGAFKVRREFVFQRFSDFSQGTQPYQPHPQPN